MLRGYIDCKADKTGEAIHETTKIMTALGSRVPKDLLEEKRLDALNSFVFNVDSPLELVDAYGRYYMRKEPLDTLERIQDAYMSAKGEELEALARSFLNPQELQVFVVADKTMSVQKDDGTVITLEEDLKGLSKALGLPYTELPLR
jgi:predicted Zn-dependent peptidase